MLGASIRGAMRSCGSCRVPQLRPHEYMCDVLSEWGARVVVCPFIAEVFRARAQALAHAMAVKISAISRVNPLKETHLVIGSRRLMDVDYRAAVEWQASRPVPDMEAGCGADAEVGDRGRIVRRWRSKAISQDVASCM